MGGVHITDNDALAASNMPARVFGKRNVATSIAGAEVLAETSKKQNRDHGTCHHDHKCAGDDFEQPKKKYKLECVSECNSEDKAETEGILFIILIEGVLRLFV